MCGNKGKENGWGVSFHVTLMCFCMVNDKCTCLAWHWIPYCVACFTFDIHRKEKRRKQNFEEREREVARCLSLENDFWRIVRLILILCWRFLGICRILSLRQRVFMEYHWSYSAVYYIYRDGDLPACGVGWLKEIFSDGNLSHHPLHLFILFYLPTILQKPSFFFSFF